MSNLIPFDAAGKLPAHLRDFSSEGNEFGFDGIGYPVISIKGKVFTINRGGEKTLVTQPGDPDTPAASLEVVILDSAPKGGAYSRTFYADGYVEGSVEKPTCHSNDGVTPESDAVEVQANKCALCPQNAKGSGATQQNPQAKACRSSKVLAVAPAGRLNDPMMLRVPGASTVALKEFGDFIAKRGVKSAGVVTRIGFDYTVAYPALTFKPVGFVTPEMSAEILAQRESPVVKSIIGERVPNEFDALPAPDAAPVPAPAPAAAPAAAKPAAKPAAKAKPAPAADEFPATPRSNVKVEGSAFSTAAPAKAPVSVADEAGIDAALDSLDFDD